MMKDKLETRRFSDGSSVSIEYDAYSSQTTEYWFDAKGHAHRDSGLPAIIGADGYESSWQHGKLYEAQE